MNIKHTGLALSALLAVAAFSACETAPTNTNTNRVNVNSNTAVVVNNNANTAVATNTNTKTTWNSNITREEYEKDKARYEREAKEAGSTIGTGANDMWLWTKAKSSLATVDDLRDSTINVDVANAVVTLKGTVATADHKKKAVDAVKTLDGVTSVKDELKVAPADSMTNMNTAATPAKANTNK